MTINHGKVNEQFNPTTKVYVGLERKLPAGLPEVAHLDRYSIDDEGGITSQVSRSTRSHLAAGDADVVAYLEIPNEAFAAERTDLHARYGISWIRLSDIHPGVVQDDDAGALVLIGKTLFARLTTGAVKRQIHRVDGPNENAYTVLLLAMSAHYVRSLAMFRWTDDPRRAARDSSNWAQILHVCKGYDQHIQFGDTVYDPSDSNIRMLLGIKGGIAEADDDQRRQSLAGGRLDAFMRGAAAMAEQQMPYGFRHLRGTHGRRVHTKDGYLPEADWSLVNTLQTAWTMHADGATYLAIGRYLGAQSLPRRGTTVDEGATFADLLAQPAALAEAAKSVFVVRARSAHSELDLYLGKHTLMSTGKLPYRINNDIVGRGVKVAGLRPTFRDDHDTLGYFDLELDWGWPKNPVTDVELVRWGLTEAQLDASRERLLEELRAPRPKAEPGHGLPHDRALSDFGVWTAEDGRFVGEASQYGVGPRQNVSGKNNCIVMARPIGKAVNKQGKPAGWSEFRSGRSVVWTFCLAELCSDLAHRIDTLVRDGLLDPEAVQAATVTRAPARDDDTLDRRRDRLVTRVSELETRHQEAIDAASGLRTAAGLKAAAGDMEGFARYDGDASERDAQAADLEADVHAAKEAIEQLVELPATEPEGEDELDVSLAAYLVAGLRRASSSNGRGPRRLRLATADAFSEWCFAPGDHDQLVYEVTLALPLASGGVTEHRLRGQVRNVNTRVGRSAAASGVVAAAVLRDGRDLDEVAARIADTTRPQTLIRHLMPWLRDHGVTARGAKNALVDHPIPMVQVIVYSSLTGETCTNAERWPQAVRDHIVLTYTDPDLAWGDSAVPDDLTGVHRLVATLATPNHLKAGLSVTEAALLLGVSERDVRELVAPQERSGGFTRPVFLEYTPRSKKQRVRLIRCPHGRCRGTCGAASLFAEVAASGYGVLCTTCRRAPNTTDEQWARIGFPPPYLKPYTGAGGLRGRLRDASQTWAAVPCQPFETAC